MIARVFDGTSAAAFSRTGRVSQTPVDNREFDEIEFLVRTGWDEGLRRRVGLRLRRTLRALERQHPYAGPAFVNRQERASLDVLSVNVERLCDDAHDDPAVGADEREAD